MRAPDFKDADKLVVVIGLIVEVPGVLLLLLCSSTRAGWLELG